MLLVSGAHAQQEGQDPQRPNILLIVADDLGYGDLSIHGSQQIKTPSLDGLARNGVRFGQAYASGSTCGPSRAGLLTGRYQQRFGFEFNVPMRRQAHPPYTRKAMLAGLPGRVTTVAEALRGAGYRTGFVGKWHLGTTVQFRPTRSGFETVFGFLSGARPYFPREKLNEVDRLMDEQDRVQKEDFEYLTDELARAALDYVAGDSSDPFFLYLAFNGVHLPMHAPAADLERHADIEPLDRRRLVAMTEALDRAVGELLGAVEELERPTLVAFMSDHGGSDHNSADNSPLRGGKGDFYEGGVRVPLFVRWPGVFEPGTISGEPVSLLDLAPTCLRAAGLEPPGNLDGRDLVAQVKHPVQRTLFWRRQPSLAIRHNGWKLIVHQDSSPELYHLDQDPQEEHDLSGDQPELVQALAERHAAWAAKLAEPTWYRSGEDR